SPPPDRPTGARAVRRGPCRRALATADRARAHPAPGRIRWAPAPILLRVRSLMKITSVEPMLVDRYLFVQIRTDTGLVGLGESGTWGHLEASAAAIAKFGDYLVGQDPSRIEHHWNVMYRSGHFRGAAIMGAISAIDIALWDIKGKSFAVPVYELLGGKTRDKARVYYHVKGPTVDAQVEKCIEARERGYTAVGHLNPFLDVGKDA